MAPLTRVVVLYGGRSAEHDISCISARFVVAQLDPARYEVVPLGITHEGRWVDVGRLVAETDDADGALPSPDRAERRDLIDVGARLGSDGDRATVVFPLLHGPMGEDGTVQGLFEVAGVPYVGAGVLASALCMDKAAAKEVLAQHGVAQGRWLSRRVDLADDDFYDRSEADLGYPMFVKPANLGSSIGISKVADRLELEAPCPWRPPTTTRWSSRPPLRGGRSRWPCSATSRHGRHSPGRSSRPTASTTTRRSI